MDLFTLASNRSSLSYATLEEAFSGNLLNNGSNSNQNDNVVIHSLLDKTKIINFDENFDKNLNQTCTICLDDFELGNELYRTKCNHVFHSNCLKNFVNSIRNPVCPNCRHKNFL